jgi:hypothetical protein
MKPVIPKLLPWMIHQYFMASITPIIIIQECIETYNNSLSLYWHKPRLKVVK